MREDRTPDDASRITYHASPPHHRIDRRLPMEPFKAHTGTFVTLDRANVDTDQIIPARYLKRIERTGYGGFLFEDVALRDGKPDPQFMLNRPEAEGASVLVARQNFGCGSSREHAVWAISQHG